MPAPSKRVNISCMLALWHLWPCCFSEAKKEKTYSCELSPAGSSPCMTAKSGARHSTGHVWQPGLEEQGVMQGAWSGKTWHANWSLGKCQRPITIPSHIPGKGFAHPSLWAVARCWWLGRAGSAWPWPLGCWHMLLAVPRWRTDH